MRTQTRTEEGTHLHAREKGPRKNRPGHTVTPNFQPPRPEDGNCLLLEPLGLWFLSQRPELAKQ